MRVRKGETEKDCVCVIECVPVELTANSAVVWFQSMVGHFFFSANENITNSLCACVCVCLSVYASTGNKKRCRGQVSEYLKQFDPDVHADIQRELATQLGDLEEG